MVRDTTELQLRSILLRTILLLLTVFKYFLYTVAGCLGFNLFGLLIFKSFCCAVYILNTSVFEQLLNILIRDVGPRSQAVLYAWQTKLAFFSFSSYPK